MRVPILLAALALATAACRDRPLPEGTVGVTMYDNGYAPPLVRVPVGGRVLFRNLGRNQHHAIALDETWSTEASFGSLVMEPGDAAEVVFDQAGIYPFYCTYHGSPLGDRGMVGVVVVGDVDYRPGGAGQPEAVREPSGVVRQVPGEYARIQEAVDAADPGDLVLVDRGVYHEAVRITTPSLVLRGTDRNEVILDGDFVLGNGVLVLADGVAVENMTARNYTLNGFYWTAATGYRGSYLTAYNNGDYGIYAFDSVDGLIEHSYASGSPDAGFYVGQCYPCRAVIRHVTAEHNALGYSGTNAGGDLYLVSSIWRRNMAGIVPNTLDTELLPPQRETVVVANLVIDNDNRDAPAKAIAWPAFGHGILVAGGRANRIERNVVLDHDGYGILVLPSRDRHFWPATDNLVRNNRVAGSGRADLAVGWPGTGGNCFEGNRHRSATPPLLERLQPCRGPRLALGLDLAPTLDGLLRVRRAAAGDFPRGESRSQPAPPAQPVLPGGAAAPVRPAVDVFEGARSGLAHPELPAEAEAYLRDREGPGPASPGRRLGRLTPLLPAALWLLWTLLSLGDLARRRDIGRARRLGWGAAVLLLPALGALLYLAAGRPRLPRTVRLAAVAGGFALWLVGVAISVLPPAGFG